MKTIGILFDVSGSMKNKFNTIDKIDKINKKSDELIEKKTKNLGKNIKTNIFTILYGLKEEPCIIHFIQLLKLSNNKLKKIKTTDENSQYFRNKLIELLSKDKNGDERACYIREYVFSSDGPSEKFSEFICHLIEEGKEIIDEIYNNLPKEVTTDEENKSLKKKL